MVQRRARNRGRFLRGLLPGFAAACVLLLSACGGPDTPEDVRLGLNLELTGDIQAVGASSRNAAEMFLDEVVKAGGIKLPEGSARLRLVIGDNGAGAAQAAQVAQRLISQDKITAMIGPNSSACAIPAADIAERLKCVMISPWSTDPLTTLDRLSGVPKRHVFRACFTDAHQAEVLARFARGRLSASRAAVLFDPSSEAPKGQAKLFRDTFTELGGDVVAFETYAPSASSYTAQLAAINAAQPDLVYLPAYYSEVPPIVRQAREAGITVPFLGSDAWIGPDLLRLAGTDLDGSYLCQHFTPKAATERTRKFVEDYTARYGRPPDDVAALTYDACGLVVAAIEKAGRSDREAVREGLSQIRNYEGVTGNFHFRPGSGDPEKSAAILRIRDGEYIWVEHAGLDSEKNIAPGRTQP